jgi:hypothetical protein
MNLTLSPQTQALLEARMKKTGITSPDEALRVALQTLAELDDEDLDDETVAAIEEGLAQARRGEGRPWEIVREELRARFFR